MEDEFIVGEVYKMNVASRSHVTKPYYVIIEEVGKNYIITNIPNEHSLIISKDTNWDYQVPRMDYVGCDEESKKLLYNQDLKHYW